MDSFVQGGPVLLAIGAFSLFAWTLVFRQALALAREDVGSAEDWAGEAVARARRGDLAGARALCAEHPGAIGRVLEIGLDSPRARAEFDRCYEPLIAGEAARLRGPLPMIAAIAAVCPLLGLLGTVLGMVGTFGAIRAGGTDPTSLAAGVSEALITTQAGLVAGLPLVLGHHWLAARVERAAAAARLHARMISGGGSR